ncbi:MAG: Imm45 family immunity protein [Mesorhizobium sp.]
MRLLTSIPDESLWRGDIIRLARNYDLGPQSAPVDLMVFDPNEDGRGLGVIVVSGYKSGAVLSVFPEESCGAGKRSLETSWLLRHWNDWFCYTYERDASGNLVPLPIEGTQILAWDEREIVAKS